MAGSTERAVLAGGCFWGMQDLIRRYPGVISTRVGYSGGEVPNATYRNHGNHAEAIEIIFDPAQTSYRKLLELFFQIHDPTTRNRQGNDVGASYRSAIFFTNDEQKRVALDTIADVEASGLWPGKVVTEVAPAGPFWEAEPEHQDYLERYPNGYTCHFVRPNWVLPKTGRRSRVASSVFMDGSSIGFRSVRTPPSRSVPCDQGRLGNMAKCTSAAIHVGGLAATPGSPHLTGFSPEFWRQHAFRHRSVKSIFGDWIATASRMSRVGNRADPLRRDSLSQRGRGNPPPTQRGRASTGGSSGGDDMGSRRDDNSDGGWSSSCRWPRRQHRLRPRRLDRPPPLRRPRQQPLRSRLRSGQPALLKTTRRSVSRSRPQASIET